MTKPKAPLMLLGHLHQIADRGKFDRGWVAALDQMKDQRHRRERQAQQDRWMEKPDHAMPAGRATTRRSASPKGVSVLR